MQALNRARKDLAKPNKRLCGKHFGEPPKRTAEAVVVSSTPRTPSITYHARP
jgi:hypothetical protein